MSATVLVHGKLFRSAERKISRGDKPYVLATIRDGQGTDAVWWNVMAFHDSAMSELLSLHDGEGVAVSGSLKAEIYEKGGKQRISLTVMADAVLTAKRQKRDKPREHQAEPARPASSRPFDDTIPF